MSDKELIRPTAALLSDHGETTESLSAMAMGVAHDFNNHLAAIIGNASLLAKGLPAESPLLKNVRQIELAAGKARELTNQLQLYTGKGDFKIMPLDLNALVQEVLAALKGSIQTGILLESKLPDNLPNLMGDPSHIRLMIENLLRNAAQSIMTDTGNITIETGISPASPLTRTEACREKIPNGKTAIFLEVNDTGCGMTADVQARIFDPFFTTRIRGRGLGLSVVRGIVDAHGGALSVQSEPGKGSTFRVIFPAMMDQDFQELIHR